MIEAIAIDVREATELAARESELERTRSSRVASAQQLLGLCFPPTVEREVDVLVEYRTFEGTRRWYRRREIRTFLLNS